MRAAILIISLLVSTTSAQILTDAENDVQLQSVVDEDALVPAGRSSLDLTSLFIAENEDNLAFEVGFSANDNAGIDGRTVWIEFESSTTQFRIITDEGGQATLYNGGYAFIQRRPIGLEWSPGGEIDYQFEPEKLTLVVERTKLVNEFGAVPLQGDSLGRFTVKSQDHFSQTGAVSAVGTYPLGDVVDQMPDDGLGQGQFEFTMGSHESQGIGLASFNPIRKSNGERSTLVFPVHVNNPLSEAKDVSLSLRNIPSNWQASLGITGAHIAPLASTTIPVIVELPGKHVHGGEERFQVQLESIDGETLDSLELGVSYNLIPQPAGHHQTVWLHSKFIGSSTAGFSSDAPFAAFLSTLEQDNRSSVQPIGPYYQESPQLTEVYGWCIPLDPSLELGILFSESVGNFQIEVASGMPLEGVIGGALFVTSGYNDDFKETSKCARETTIQNIVQLTEAPIQIEQGSTASYQSEVTGLLDALPYDAGRELILNIEFTVETPSPFRNVDVPRILPGGFMLLPLDEYIDPVVLPNVAKLVVNNDRALRNPGATALFSLQIEGSEGEFRSEVLGVNNEWARYSSGRFSSGQFEIAVDVPQSAKGGDYADLIVKAIDEQTGELMLARIFVEVDESAQHPDDAEASSHVGLEGQETPATLATLVLALGIASLIVNRRGKAL